MALASGCGPDAAGTAPPTVTDSAGVPFVESVGPAWGGEARWAVDSVPSVQIGVLDGEAPYLFESIRGVTRLPDGRFALAESATREIRLYDAEGRHLVSIGREGQGPGEFQTVPDFSVLPGDTILALDRRVWRLTWFTLDGEVVRDAQFDQKAAAPNMAGVFSTERVILPGNALFHVGGFAPNNTEMTEFTIGGGTAYAYSPVPGLTTRDIRIGLLSLDGTDNVVLGRFPTSESGYVEGDAPLTGAFRITNPYFPAVRHAVGRDPVLVHVATPGSREIRTFDRSGELVRVVRQRAPLEPLDPAVIADFRALIEDSVRAREGADPRAAMELFDEIVFPDSVFPWSALEADRAGNLWALHSDPEGDDPAPTYDVFDPDGAWLGVLAMPPDAGTVEEIGDDYVLTIWTDDFDVEYLRMYSLRKTR